MLALATNPEVEAFYAHFQNEVTTFERQLPSLLQQFPGEYVAIYQGKVIAHRGSWDEVASYTRDRYPYEFVLIEKVVPAEKITVNMDTLEG